MSGAARSRGLLAATLLATLFAIPAVSCGSGDPTPAEVRASCENDPKAACCGDGDCPADSACDFSFVCAQESNLQVACDAPTGDRQCHARCDAQHPCPTGQVCRDVTIYDGSDGGRGVKMCRGAGS
jgi:hypothetical protein